LMVVFIGFGYAKPVPMNSRALTQPWTRAIVAAAGPLMNLLLAMLAINYVMWASRSGATGLSEIAMVALSFVAKINLLLMLFNLIPLGALDGHYILSWLLPSNLSAGYERFNNEYGSKLFLILIVLSILGLPIFNFLMSLSALLVPYITFVH